MHVLHSGVALRVFAFWLAHESTTTMRLYVEAPSDDEANRFSHLQEAASASTRYRPSDELMRFLRNL